MEPQGRFVFDSRPSQGAELRRLTLLSEYYQPLMEELFLRCKQNNQTGGNPYRTIIDIGAGTGHTTILLKKLFPEAQVAYFDSSQELTAAAREKARAEHCDIAFVNGDIHSHTFSRPYDFVFSRFTLKHLYDPHLAIRRMVEILTPGGRILLMDKDVTANIWFPAFPLYNTKYMTALNRLNNQSHRGGDSAIGRKIKYHLAQNGIKQLLLEAHQTSLTDPRNKHYRDLQVGVYINLLPELAEAGLISEADGRKDIGKLVEFLENEHHVAMTFDFIVTGIK